MAETSPVAWLALVVAVVSLGWQILTHIRRHKTAVREHGEVRRSEQEREAIQRVLGQVPPVIDMCGNYIEQFPEDAPPVTVTIPPRKVANRLANLRQVWRDEESLIRSETLRGAYDAIAVDRLLREIPRTDGPTMDYVALIPLVKDLRASVENFRRALRDALR